MDIEFGNDPVLLELLKAVADESRLKIVAMLAAREALKSRRERVVAPRVAVIVGAQAHYSVARAAAILGMGSDAVFRVPMDHEYRTDIARVAQAFVSARRAGFRKVCAGRLRRVYSDGQL